MALSFGPIPGGWDGSKIRPIPKARGAGGSRILPKRPAIKPGLPMPAASNMFTGLSGREMGQAMPASVKSDFFFPGARAAESKRRRNWHATNKIRAFKPKRTNRFYIESTHNHEEVPRFSVSKKRGSRVKKTTMLGESTLPDVLDENPYSRQIINKRIRSVDAALKFPARETKRINQEIMRASQIQKEHRRAAKKVDQTKVKGRKRFGQDGYDSDYGSKKKRR